MGTTLTAAVLSDDQVLVIGHVGDSRAYLSRDGELGQLTVDHSVVAELIAAGQLTEAEAEIDPAARMITRALGIDVDVEVDVITVDLALGDRLLFCSDGLTTMLRDDAIADVLRSERRPRRGRDAWSRRANEAGGADNITVLLVDVVDDDTPDPAPEAEVEVEVEAEARADRRDPRRRRRRRRHGGSPDTRADRADRADRGHRADPSRRRRRRSPTFPPPAGAGAGRTRAQAALVAAAQTVVSARRAPTRRRMTELFLGLLALGITVFGYVLVQLADTPNLPPDLWAILAAVSGLFVVAPSRCASSRPRPTPRFSRSPCCSPASGS